MAADIFLKLTGIEGESKDEKHNGQIEIEGGWSWSLSQSGTQHRIGGGGEAQATVGDFNCSTMIDAAVAALTKHVQKGDHIDEALLTQRKAGGIQEEFFKLTMKKCIVTNFTFSSGGSGINVNLSLNFEEYMVEYAPQTDEGTLGAVKQFGYNIAKRLET